jgi:hypothetical protein
MNHTTLTAIVFSFLVLTLVFAIWSNTHVFAQQLPSVSSSAASPAAGNLSSSPSNTISSELKAKMCDPGNPGLKVVNTTESRICGIPKTIKPSLLSSSATPPTSAAVSSSASPSQQQTTTTKPTTAAATNGATPPPKQQQIATTNNANASSRSITNSVAGATIAPVSNPRNKSLSSPSPPSSAIAPQVKAVNEQQHHPPASSSITPINGTDGQNYTSVASPPVVSSGKLLYLGYHDEGDSNPTNGDTGPKDKSVSGTKPSIGRSTSTTSDNDSTEKKKKERTSSTKLGRDDSTNDKSSSKKDKSNSFDSRSSSHTNTGAESSSSSELASSIRNKVNSITRNSIGGIIDKTPFLLPFP